MLIVDAQVHIWGANTPESPWPARLGAHRDLPIGEDELRRVYDAFGPKRTFWGTDLSRLPCTYRQGVTMFTEEIPWLSAEDKTWIMGAMPCQ